MSHNHVAFAKLIPVVFGLLLITTADLLAEQTYVFKIATLAPEGSVWMNELKLLNSELAAETNNAVQFKLYPGGIMGDDEVVLRKIRVGQLDGAAFTTNGMSKIEPSYRLLSLPALFSDEKEIDCILPKIKTRLETMVINRGFETMGLVGLGFAYMYTKNEVTDLDGLKRTKPWLWENDAIMKSLYNAAGVVPIAVGIGDVMTGLETGMLDTVFNTPTGLLAMQWFTKVNYMMELPMIYSFGAFVIDSKRWNTMPADLQKIVRKSVDQHLKTITDEIRAEDTNAKEVMKSRNLKLSVPSETFKTSFNELSLKTHKEFTTDPEAKAFLDELSGFISECRSSMGISEK